MSSIFKQIIDGKIPCQKVLENDTCLAFYDINPQAPIHVLIIPKKEIPDFTHLDAQSMVELLAFTQDVVKTLNLKEGYRLITNVGSHGGQEVPHLHFHLLGGAKLKWEKLA